jgi:hypothetical protein
VSETKGEIVMKDKEMLQKRLEMSQSGQSAVELAESAGFKKGYREGVAVGRKQRRARVDTDDYWRGYRAGFATGRARARVDMGEERPDQGRPAKYPWSSLKIGDTFVTPETNTKNIMTAGYVWAKRNAPGRKFRIVGIFDDGVKVERVS